MCRKDTDLEGPPTIPYDAGMGSVFRKLSLIIQSAPLLYILVCLLACDDARPPAPPPPAGDGRLTKALRLQLLDEIDGVLRLRSDETVSLRFRLDEPESEEPVPDVSLHCVGVGATEGIQLSGEPTDAAGETEILLHTGSDAAYFTLQCRAVRSNPVELGAAVSPSFEFEDAHFAASYPGERNLRELLAMLHVGTSCDAAPGKDPAASRRGRVDETLIFESVPVELAFTIILELTDSKKRPGARGCAEGVFADGEVRSISLEDLPFSAAGDYQARLDLEAPSLVSDLAQAGELAASALIGADDGNFLMGRLMSGLQARGMQSDYQQLLLSQIEYGDQLRFELAALEAGPSYAVDSLGALVEESAGALRLEGTFIIEGNAPSHLIRFRTSAIYSGRALASLSTMRAADFDGDPDAVGAAYTTADEFYLNADLSFGFNRSAMVLAGAKSALDSSAQRALSTVFGCDAFTDFYAFATLVECDPNCLADICSDALSTTIDAFYNGVRNAAGIASSLQLNFGLDIESAGAFPDRIRVDGLVASFGGGAIVPSATLIID